MANEISKGHLSVFEAIKQTDEKGNEWWSARDLAKVLEYSEYRHFIPVIDRAKDACSNSGQPVADHFEDILDMIELGKTAKRGVESIRLSRYACYLIVQNADPSKEIVALGQTYFAVQTRLQEIRQMDEYNKLSNEEEKRLFLRHEMAKHNTQLAAAIEKVKELDYLLTPGRYAGLTDEEDDFDFAERFASLKKEPEAQLKEEEDLNKKIAANLAKIKLPEQIREFKNVTR